MNGCATIGSDGRDGPEIYGFVHIATVNHWRDIVAEQFAELRLSGLLDRTRRLFVTLLGPECDQFDWQGNLLEVVHRSADLEECELVTLAKLHEFCRDHDGLVYYIHSKGVFSEPAAPTVADWRQLMQHFVIGRHAECIAGLGNCAMSRG